MESWNNIVTDWVNLPVDSKIRSLWVCLHDAEIKSITSDLAEQSVILEIEAFYLPDDLKVSLHLASVKSARVYKYPPPFQHLITDETSFTEKLRVAEGWESKWREESISWWEFEAAMPTDPLDIADADLAEKDGQIALRIDRAGRFGVPASPANNGLKPTAMSKPVIMR